MKQKGSYRIKLVLIGIVTTIVFGSGHANADFTFGEPVNLGPTVNGPDHDQMPSISADGLELYFMSRRPGGIGDWDIWVAKRKTINDPWLEPENIGPIVNSSGEDWAPSVSADGLEIYFEANRPGGYGGTDILVASRKTIDEPWGNPVNLGPTVNSPSRDGGPSISSDGLELYFKSNRPGGHGDEDLWVSKRQTKYEPWDTPVNLGPNVNGWYSDRGPSISNDGLMLFFSSTRTGGYGLIDLWLTSRATKDDAWGEPVNIGPAVNKTYTEDGLSISTDGRTLYFSDYYYTGIRPGGYGGADLYKMSIIPIVDFNSDGFVDSADMCMMVDHWGENYSLCDIGPMPWGDGVVDVEDLKVLAEHLFEEVFPVELIGYWKLDEAEGDIAYNSVSDSNGVLNGNPTWQPDSGQVDGALQFDGIDDYISTDFVLNPADGSFSAFAWIKGGEPGQVVLSQKGEANWLSADPSEGNFMTELVPPTTRSALPPLVSETRITDSNWHHIGFVWNGAYRTLYVDGIVVAEDLQSNLAGSSNGLYIGAGNNLAEGTFFSGLIDDVRIYNRVVSP